MNEVVAIFVDQFPLIDQLSNTIQKIAIVNSFPEIFPQMRPDDFAQGASIVITLPYCNADKLEIEIDSLFAQSECLALASVI